MEKEFIEEMKKRLIEEKNEILETIASHNDDLKNLIVSPESGDVVDIASDVIDGNLIDSLGAQNKQRLQLINSALDRIRQGTYGICPMCKKEINRERLEAIPYAFLCISCQHKQEMKNRK